MLDRHLVPIHAHSHNDGGCFVAQIAVSPPLLARMHVADVQLNEGDANASEGVPDGDGCVREGARIDDDTVHALCAGGLNPVDDGTLVVGLECLQIGGKGGGVRDAVSFDVGKRRSAVDMGLASAQKVEVGAVDQEDGLFVDHYGWPTLQAAY
ncbi:hypothetical protein VTO42DRAFT_6487 [Malbranchea cinnamomea]